jgi:NAD-dependent deacetylase
VAIWPGALSGENGQAAASGLGGRLRWRGLPPRRGAVIFVLTGAGVSQESGLDTFRGQGGLWRRVRIEDVATPEAFRRDPRRVFDFYDLRRRELAKAAPNAAHLALAELEGAGAPMALVTQNVDDLHERAGSRQVIHMHGELNRALCQNCQGSIEWLSDLGPDDKCPKCGGPLRPDVVWFGEAPCHLPEIERALGRCTLFVAIGTSGVVHPAAGLVRLAKAAGAATMELNLEPSANKGAFDQAIYGPASKVVPAWTRSLLASRRASGDWRKALSGGPREPRPGP